MWSKIKPVLASLFSSKKFLALLAAVILWILSKAGVVLEEADLMPILLLVGAYIGAQGIADMGKERAKVEGETIRSMEAAKENPPAAQEV